MRCCDIYDSHTLDTDRPVRLQCIIGSNQATSDCDVHCAHVGLVILHKHTRTWLQSQRTQWHTTRQPLPGQASTLWMEVPAVHSSLAQMHITGVTISAGPAQHACAHASEWMSVPSAEGPVQSQWCHQA